eukprot:scaffold36365_cov29-Attheya_sp.AAC.1
MTTSQKRTEQWNQMYSLLEAYKEIHGDCLVPNRYIFNPKLGIWVSTQRKDKKKEKMQPEREERLRRIGFSWETADPRHVVFSERIQLLTKFKEENGHCKVPTKCEGPYKKLGIWVDRQRQQYKNLKAAEEAGNMVNPWKRTRTTSITAEEIRCLEELGFEWEVARGGRGPNTSPRNSGHIAEGEIEKLVKTSENMDLDVIWGEPIQFSERSQEIIARDQQTKTLISGLTSSNGAGQQPIDLRNTVSNSDSEEKNHNVTEDENDTMIFGHISHVVPKD